MDRTSPLSFFSHATVRDSMEQAIGMVTGDQSMNVLAADSGSGSVSDFHC